MTLMCIERSQSPTHKGNFLQGGKSSVNNNLNQQNANHQRRNSCSPPLCKNQQQQDVSNAIKSLNLDSTRKLERSTSEPTDRRTAVQSNSSRYKTELCRPFEENGTCKYGDKCQFAHGMKELRSMARHPKYKTELCRTFHSTGLCPYGPRCHFIHNSEQSKKSMFTNLTGNVPQSPPLPTRPKALTSLGSAGDISPESSQDGSPTGSKSFDDIFHPQKPTSPTSFFNIITNRVSQGLMEIHGRDIDRLGEEFLGGREFVNNFHEGMLSNADNNVDNNFNFQGGSHLELFQTGPLTPSTPLDGNGGFFYPVFGVMHNKQQVM